MCNKNRLFHDQRWKYERCKHCGVDNHIGFQAQEQLWSAVVRGEYNVLCLNCFLHLAFMRGIAVSEEDIKMFVMYDEVPLNCQCQDTQDFSIGSDA
jgi:hypothetical protein